MIRLYPLYTILLIGVFLMSCGGSNSSWNEMDFMRYGLPVKMKVPDGVEVTKSTISDTDEFKLKGPDDFGMTVLMMDASNPNVAAVKSELQDFVKRGKYFSEFIEEEENGFVYQLKIDSVRSVYGFRKVKIQGGKQIIFQNPYMSKLTEEMALNFYHMIPD